MSKRPTILVVDDLPDNIEVIGEILSSSYDIQCAFSGREALDLVAEKKPDLILLDVMMPEMDGYEVLINLQGAAATQDIPIIFVTAKDDTESESAALQAGAVDFIHKPVNPDVVRARVALFLALKGRENSLRHLNEVLRNEITERNKTEAQLRLAFAVLNSTSEGVMVTDESLQIISVNPAFSQITGYRKEEAIGQGSAILQSNHHDDLFYQQVTLALQTFGCWQGEVWNRRKTGEVFPAWQAINRVEAKDGHPACLVTVFRDISEQHEQNERMRFLAFHDALTGLPNRALLLDRLEQAVQRARRHRQLLAVLFIDLDGFKAVNDQHGHDAGDLLLQEVSRRICGLIRRGGDTVARLGGDEFVVLLEDIAHQDQVDLLVEQLINAISQPVILQGNSVRVGASIGISFGSVDGADAAGLIQHADAAMYVAKAEGKGCAKQFVPGMRGHGNADANG